MGGQGYLVYPQLSLLCGYVEKLKPEVRQQDGAVRNILRI